MSIPLATALAQVELESGKTYSCQVRELWVEVRVLDCESGMLDAWVELPPPTGGKSVTSHLGPPPLPDIPEIPSDAD